MSHRKQRHGCRLQRSIVKLQQAIEPGAARPVKGAFERLEPRAVKVACAVLRGLGGSNTPRLPDELTGLSRAEIEVGFAFVVGFPARLPLQSRPAAQLLRWPPQADHGEKVF